MPWVTEHIKIGNIWYTRRRWRGLGNPASGGESSELVTDTFTDDDDTAITSHTPDVDSVGNGYAYCKRLSTTPGTPTATIQTNKVQISVNDTGFVIDTDESDVTIVVDWTPAVGFQNRNSIILRYSSNGNMWALNFREDNNDMTLYEINSDTPTSRDSDSYTFDEGTTYEIKVVASGQTITGYVNGSPIVSYSSASFNETETKHGLLRDGGSNATRFDNLSITK